MHSDGESDGMAQQVEYSQQNYYYVLLIMSDACLTSYSHWRLLLATTFQWWSFPCPCFIELSSGHFSLTSARVSLRLQRFMEEY